VNEYRYPKSGYSYYAAKLVFGQSSPHVRQFSVFSLPPHCYKRLRYSEVEERRRHMGSGDWRNFVFTSVRTLHIDGVRMLRSHRTEGTLINTALTFQYTVDRRGTSVPQIDVVTDIMFSEREYEQFRHDWNDQIQFKVDMLARLIKAVDTGDMETYPMFIADFPEIAKYLVEVSPFMGSRDPIWDHD